MKFFTQELFERAHAADDRVVSAAEDDWERANEQYEEHLQRLAGALPGHVKAFSELLLHDAAVQSIARQGDQLVLILRQDMPPSELIILRYDLAGEPVLEPFVRQPHDWSAPTTFNFDEFDLTQEGSGALYTQAIVFANGWLLRLRFRDVQVILAQPLYVAPQAGPAVLAAPFLPRSA